MRRLANFLAAALLFICAAFAADHTAVVVLFDGDLLKTMDTGGNLPTEQEFVASIDTFKTPRNAPSLELTPEQTKALPDPPKPATIEIEPVGPTREYPPLEPRT